MNKYMKLANDLATSNLLTNDGGPFGAVIVKNNKIIAEFGGVRDAGRKTGIGRVNIGCCCRGIQKTAGGYEWKYAK